MTFGQRLKQLRQKADFTQEQLAEELSVSGQAVSRWENGSAMPDIFLFPILAEIFGVTTDYLLGVDGTKKAEKIKKILNGAAEYAEKGLNSEAAAVIRAGLKEHPRSYELMYWLQHYIFYAHRLYLEGGEGKAEQIAEVISLGEKILSGCTDDTIRYQAIELLCRGYSLSGELTKAEELVNSLPTVYDTRQALSAKIHKGSKQFEMKSIELGMLIQAAIIRLCGLNTRLDDGSWALSPEENEVRYQNALTLIDMLYPDGDLGSCVVNLIHACIELAFIRFNSSRLDEGMEYLGKAVEASIEFTESYDEARIHTSPLMKGFPYGKVHFVNTVNPHSALLDRINDSGHFDSISATEEGKGIIRLLEEHSM